MQGEFWGFLGNEGKDGIGMEKGVRGRDVSSAAAAACGEWVTLDPRLRRLRSACRGLLSGAATAAGRWRWRGFAPGRCGSAPDDFWVDARLLGRTCSADFWAVVLDAGDFLAPLSMAH